jgi:hypothetical protein
MPRLATIALFCWLGAAAATALPGWPIVRFLPLWASIPMMAALAFVTTCAGVVGIAFAVPGDGQQIKRGARLYSVLLALAAGTPAVIAVSLFKYVA